MSGIRKGQQYPISITGLSFLLQTWSLRYKTSLGIHVNKDPKRQCRAMCIRIKKPRIKTITKPSKYQTQSTTLSFDSNPPSLRYWFPMQHITAHLGEECSRSRSSTTQYPTRDILSGHLSVCIPILAILADLWGYDFIWPPWYGHMGDIISLSRQGMLDCLFAGIYPWNKRRLRLRRVQNWLIDTRIDIPKGKVKGDH